MTWNATVANLTLMALGSSAPEILLSVIEIIVGKFYSGELGPSTIVGSAAFNMLVILGICVMCIPEANEKSGETGERKIADTGVFAITAAAIILDQSRFTQNTDGGRRPPFDWLGSILSATALSTILLAMSFGNRVGWGSIPILAALGSFVILLASFIWWELHSPSPMLDLRLFKRKLVAMGIAAGWLSFLGSSAVRFLIAIYLQSVLGFSPRAAGLITLPMAVTMTFVGPVSGRLSDRFGWQKFNVGGSVIAALSLFLLAFSLTDATPVIVIMLILVLQSAGTGLFGSPNNSSIFSAVEKSRYGIVSALTSLTRNSANITSNAVATAIVVATMASLGAEPNLSAVSSEPFAFVAGLNRAFMVAGFMLVIATVISFLKGDRIKEELEVETEIQPVEAQQN